jgi:hypothetical protein
VDDDELFREIGKKGDELWSQQLPQTHAGHEIPLDEAPPPGWSLLHVGWQLVSHPSPSPGTMFLWVIYLVSTPLLLVLDVVHLLLRVPVYPLVLLEWWCEKRLALWLGRFYFCPVCHHLMDEPYAFCPNKKCPRRVQPRLRPYFHSMFLHTCPECGRGRWLIPGQRFLFPPKPLVCRHTRKKSGCYHPLALPALRGRFHLRFIALLGATVRVKHCVMAHLFGHLTEKRPHRKHYQPAWRVSALELDLCRRVLCRAMTEETSRFETPGQHYTLALTFLLKEARRRRLLVFHNVVQNWLARTELLAKNSLNWQIMSGLVFVLDYQRLGLPKSDKVLPDAELYSRLVRVVEEYCGLEPGQPVPFRVAVVLAVPADARTDLLAGPTGELTSEEVQDVVRNRGPALHALLVRTVVPGRLRFFGGLVPNGMDLSMTPWIPDVLEWVA